MRAMVIHKAMGLCAVESSFTDRLSGRVEYQLRPVLFDVMGGMAETYGRVRLVTATEDSLVKPDIRNPAVQALFDLLCREIPHVAWSEVRHDGHYLTVALVGYMSINGGLAKVVIPISVPLIEGMVANAGNFGSRDKEYFLGSIRYAIAGGTAGIIAEGE